MIKYDWRKWRFQFFALKIELTVGEKILKLIFYQFLIDKIDFFFIKQNGSILFSSIFVWNMSSYGQILVPKRQSLVPKTANLGWFGPKPYLKTPNACKFLDQNYHWVEIIKGEKRVENLIWGVDLICKTSTNKNKSFLIFF